ncbi:MAG: hypothetical protein CMJ67_07705 [Planctomycetaceae bacterium]|nr:hypothetical protein [Planctomycetaceae bacterium]
MRNMVKTSGRFRDVDLEIMISLIIPGFTTMSFDVFQGRSFPANRPREAGRGAKSCHWSGLLAG